MNPQESSTSPSRDLVAQAQAFLFVEGGTLSLKNLAGKLHVDQIAIGGIVDELAGKLAGTGITLIRTETEVSLAVAPAVSEAIEAAYTEDKEIGDAGLEVLAIVLYRGASTKTQIDYIRGVNTSSTVRTLLSRGLIERAGNPADSREYLYRPTSELLAHLGVARVEDLPNYDKISSALNAFSAGGGSLPDRQAGTSGGEGQFDELTHGTDNNPADTTNPD